MRTWGPGPSHAPAHRHCPVLLLIDPHTFTRNCFAEVLRRELPDVTVRASATMDDFGPADGGRIVLAAVNIDDKLASDPSVRTELLRLQAAAPSAPVALLSRRDDDDVIRRETGGQVRGFIPTMLPLDIVVAALRLVLAGGSYDPRHVIPGERASTAKPTLAAVPGRGSASTIALPCAVGRSTDPSAGGLAWRLTPREAQVLEALKRGQANKVIAYELNLSENTVKVHIQRIMRKLQVTNRTEAVVMAQQHPISKAG